MFDIGILTFKSKWHYDGKSFQLFDDVIFWNLF